MSAKRKKRTSIIKSLIWLMILVAGISGVLWANWEKIPKKYRDQFDRNRVKIEAQLRNIDWDEWKDIPLPQIQKEDFKLPEFDFFQKKPPSAPDFRKPLSPSMQGEVPLPGERLHYVRVGRCLFKSCVFNFKSLLNEMKMNVQTKSYLDKTKFYDVVSIDAFLQPVAENILETLKNQNNTRFTPVIQRKRGKYILSFGSFPQQEQAEELESYLLQIQLETNVLFHTVTVYKKYRVTKVYAGPFTSKANAQVAHRQLKNRAGLEDSFVTSKF